MYSKLQLKETVGRRGVTSASNKPSASDAADAGLVQTHGVDDLDGDWICTDETQWPEKSPCYWLVDDDSEVRELLAKILTEHEGLKCSGQFPGAAARLAALRTQCPPEVIVMDLNMPEMDGIAAIAPAKSIAPGTNVIILTTFSDSKERKRALRSGASEFLLKHYSARTIADSIRRVARGAPVSVQDVEPVTMPETVQNNQVGKFASSRSSRFAASLARLLKAFVPIDAAESGK